MRQPPTSPLTRWRSCRRGAGLRALAAALALGGSGAALGGLAAFGALSALNAPVVAAQRVGEYQLKAAFLFHVTQFVEWPADSFASAAQPFRICLVGGDPFGAAIRTLESKHYRDRPIRVELLAGDDDIGRCQLAYFSGEPPPPFADVAHGRSALPILTVGSDDGFAAGGGMIRFVSIGERLRMEINAAVARNAHLKLSAKLLEVAARVIDPPDEGTR